MHRITVYISGQVQGVGFRYTTRSLAKDFAVAGYVMNLPDGRVLLVAEGEPEQTAGLLDAVRRTMARHITDIKTDTGVANGEFGRVSDPGTFSIRH